MGKWLPKLKLSGIFLMEGISSSHTSKNYFEVGLKPRFYEMDPISRTHLYFGPLLGNMLLKIQGSLLKDVKEHHKKHVYFTYLLQLISFHYNLLVYAYITHKSGYGLDGEDGILSLYTQKAVKEQIGLEVLIEIALLETPSLMDEVPHCKTHL